MTIKEMRTTMEAKEKIVTIEMTKAEAMALWELLDRTLSEQFRSVEALRDGIDMREVVYFRNRLTNRIADRPL